MRFTSRAQLAPYSLARQFPVVTGRDATAVADLVERIGAIQSQTARSVFLGVAARLPGVTHDAITKAYEQLLIVRGSTMRGTVHTCVAGRHPLLNAATRLGLRRQWERTLNLHDCTLEQVWAGLEEFARDQWRTPDELRAHLLDWVTRHDPHAEHTLGDGPGRYYGISHGGLIRRPLKGPWSGQGAPGYRAAAAALALDYELPGPDDAVDELVRVHVRAHGPSSARDIAWWSGVNLKLVTASTERLADQLVDVAELDGVRYLDLPDPPDPVEFTGIRLLPEFDALLCGYDPKARDRFVDAEGYQVLWLANNGLLRAPVLHGHRITGYWRLEGSGRTRQAKVVRFDGAPPITSADVDEPLASVAAAMDVQIGSVTID